MKKISGLLLFTVLILFACNKENNWIELDIVETGCMNAWDDFYTGDNDSRDAVQRYLKHNGISVYRVYSHSYYDGPVCLACYCPTGRLIVIQIPEQDQTKAEQLGFQRVINGDFNIP
uniref:hypothetical protein n=1 Tax=uncultured Draconibacterium sp. TaxID=1573823 RepID=UPI0032176EC5